MISRGLLGLGSQANRAVHGWRRYEESAFFDLDPIDAQLSLKSIKTRALRAEKPVWRLFGFVGAAGGMRVLRLKWFRSSESEL